MLNLPDILAPTPDPPPRISRRRIPFDDEAPWEAFCKRVEHRPSGGALWLAPRATVSCSLPTKAFWCIVYAEQGAWMHEARSRFGRRPVDSPEAWKDPHLPGATQSHKRAHRQACLTGLLLINGEVIPLRNWPTRQQVGYKPKRRRRKRPDRLSLEPTNGPV